MALFYQGGVVDGVAAFSPALGLLPVQLVRGGRISPAKLRAALAASQARRACTAPTVGELVTAMSLTEGFAALAQLVREGR